MKNGVIIGAIFILIGISLFAYYMQRIEPEREARQLLTEGVLMYERGDREAINSSINVFTRVIARYPGTRSQVEAYYYIAQSYEKLGLNRLAYLKYLYILKNFKEADQNLVKEINARLARLRVMKRYTEEGIYQLFNLLNMSSNRDFRSRVYTELGHTYLKTGSLDKAKRMFDIALTEKGDNEEAILGKARTYKKMGRDNQAYDLYEYFLKYYGNFSPYTGDVRKSFLEQVYRSGYDSFKRGSYYAAISYFKRLIRNFPEEKKVENSLYWTGESYFSVGKYHSAIKYFNKTLANGYAHKDQDALIKKGFSYYQLENYDVAARDFQSYLEHYPYGRHNMDARKWKERATKEILYRLRDRDLPELKEEELDKRNDPEDESGGPSDNKEVSEESRRDENVAEL